MSDATIVTEDAERLVTEGGVYNSNMPPPDVVVMWPDGTRSYRDREPPFTAEAKEWRPAGQWGGVAVKVGTVTVADVHHSDDCRHYVPVYSSVGGAPEPEVAYCHPDAKPNYWHWWTEPLEAS